VAILKIFADGVSVRGKHPSSELFAHCPPPVRTHGKTQALADPKVRVVEQDARVNSPILRAQKADATAIPAETSVLAKGWLCGIVDGEGYVHIRYRSDRDSTYPRLRIFVKTWPIIVEAARVMGVYPYARRENGKLKGWYASVSHMKAMRVLRLIAPHLADPSKKCRAVKILDAFGRIGTVHSRIGPEEFFSGCPPPCRVRKYRRIINRR
jgi:hypothetical protein